MISHGIVIAGAGVAHESAEALDLMEHAARHAASDAGNAALLRSIDTIITPRGTWNYDDPGRALARRVGADTATTIVGELGVSQQGLMNEAIDLVARRASRAVLVVGGESRRHNREQPYSEAVGPPDRTMDRPLDFVDPLEIEVGLAFPAVRSYALIQQALASAQGLDDQASADKTAALWATFSAVASRNPRAAFGEQRTAAFLATASRTNQILATPYLRWHASQWSVDQAAALIITSVEHLGALGADPSQAIHAHVALESSHVVPLARRRNLASWPAMGVLGHAAGHHLGISLDDIAHREVYSCFPVAVAVQAAELGLSTNRDLTLTGGMAFAGGPFNSFVLQSTAAMVPALRGDPGSLGLVTTVSGLLTKPGLAVWSTEAYAGGTLSGDLGAEAGRRTATIELDPHPSGRLVVETSTTFTDDDGPRGIAFARGADDRRSIISTRDPSLVESFSSVEAIGTTISAP